MKSMTQRRFRPSQANYWGNCAAFVRFSEGRPEQPSGDAAREGTCAAWVAEVVLTGDAGSCLDLLGETHSNGWVVDETMVDLVQGYVDKVRSFGGTVVAEKHVTASQNPLIDGTLDSAICSIENRILRIPDLKYGRRVVEAYKNKQLICYGWGEFISLPPGTIDEIHLSIYQPRAFHRDGIHRTWVVTPEELHAEFMKLWLMAVEGEKPDSLATPGPHCRDCESAVPCLALTHTVYNLVDTVASRDQRDMTVEELSRELDFIDAAEKTVKARFNAVRSEAEARMKKESIPNWSLSPNKGNRVFTEPGVTIHLMTGVDPFEKTLCTPAALERRGADPEIVKKLTKQPVTSHKLTRLDTEFFASLFNKDKSS
jgi:hypothetical protein